MGRKLYILGVAGYDTPIWDVLALQGVQEEVGEHMYGDRLIIFSPIRQVVPVGLLRLGFVLGLMGSVFQAKKGVLVANMYLHLLQNFPGIMEGSNGWMAADELG